MTLIRQGRPTGWSPLQTPAQLARRFDPDPVRGHRGPAPAPRGWSMPQPAMASAARLSATPSEGDPRPGQEGPGRDVRNKASFGSFEPWPTAELDELTQLRLLIEVPSRAPVSTRCSPRPRTSCGRWPTRSKRKRRGADRIAHHRPIWNSTHSTARRARQLTLVPTCDSCGCARGCTAAPLPDAGTLKPSAHDHSELLELLVANDGWPRPGLMQHIGHVPRHLGHLTHATDARSVSPGRSSRTKPQRHRPDLRP